MNEYIGSLANLGQVGDNYARAIGQAIPSPVVLGQVAEKFREAVKTMAEQVQIPIFQFDHKERKHDDVTHLRQPCGVGDGTVTSEVWRMCLPTTVLRNSD